MAQTYKTQPSIEALEKILTEKQCAIFVYPASEIIVDMATANVVLNCYKVVSDEHKAKMARMIAASPGQFSKLAEFAWKAH